MKCKIIKNRYATEMHPINIDIKRLVINPNYYEKKDDAPLFNFSSNICEKPTKRAGFNHQGSSILVLDFDCGFTFEDWMKKYPNLLDVTFLAYSSFSNSPEKAKFRVIIPLDRVYTDVEWKALTPSLKRYFPENDVCSFQISRFFNVPIRTKHYWSDLNFKSVNLNLLDMLSIDDGFLSLLVSRIKDKDMIEEVPQIQRVVSVMDYICIDNLTVKDWLNTYMNPNGGNGGIRTRGSYSAVQLCKKFGDYETLNLVKRKCYQIGLAKWYDKQR